MMASELAGALVKGEKETEGVHYKVDEKQKSVLMTEEGYEAAENCLGVSHTPSRAVVSSLLYAFRIAGV